jgi:hypothetical protein
MTSQIYLIDRVYTEVRQLSEGILPQFFWLVVALVPLFIVADETQAEPARGLENPTLSFNLATPHDYNPGLQFIDLMKMMRPWIGHKDRHGWGGMNENDLREGGYLDADGWVKSIPDGFDRVGTIWTWSDFSESTGTDHAGRYVIRYNGSGELGLRGGARLVSSRHGHIIFENLDASTFILDIIETDPEKTGDYIRDITIIAEKHVDLFHAGGVFNPDWIELVQDARGIRFMDWMYTNGSKMVSWNEMPSVNGPFSGRGIPIEYMVRLANELGADPWFTMPHLADETFVRNFATFVRDNLDPALTVRVEYSNEVWNFAFEQTHWLREQASKHWGADAYIDYHTKKAVETALIWEEVYGDEASNSRLTNVLGTFLVNPWVTKRLLEAPAWLENEPDKYVDPRTIFEEVATSVYFGFATVGDEQLRAELIANINNPSVDTEKWLAERLLDSKYNNSIPQVAAMLKETAQIVHSSGLRLVAYEGGQHLHHSFAVRGLTDADISALDDFMFDFVRGNEMALLYQELWHVWKQYGDDAFMQFVDIQSSSRWGTWGLWNGLSDNSPRAETLMQLNSTTTPWWEGAKGGEFRQQGVTKYGGALSEMMFGTSQEDYLMGGDGHDTFFASSGNDGINGGKGNDRFALSGSPLQYAVQPEGEGFRVTGPNGDDFIILVEELAFGNDGVLVIADLTVGNDGFLIFPGVVR